MSVKGEHRVVWCSTDLYLPLHDKTRSASVSVLNCVLFILVGSIEKRQGWVKDVSFLFYFCFNSVGG